MSLVITSLYTSLTAMLIFGLTINVIKLRRKLKIGIGTKGNQELMVANRAHGNLLENAPIVLLLFLVAEVNGTSSALLHCFGTIWIVARLLQAIGLIKGKGGLHFGRMWGTLGTWLVLLGLILVNLIGFIQAV